MSNMYSYNCEFPVTKKKDVVVVEDGYTGWLPIFMK